MTDYRYGFRVLGSAMENRRLIVWADAFRAYCDCDPRAQVDRESYLSAFTFGEDFAEHLKATGSTKGFNGPCWTPWLWFDLDRPDLDTATRDARRLATATVETLGLSDDDLLIFYSGSKGFHVGLPTATWGPEPSALFHKVARRFAEHLAGLAGVTIDVAAYTKVQPFRAPNSKHGKTGRHKRRLTVGELMHLAPAAITERAATPEAFEIPEPTYRLDKAATLWAEAATAVQQEAEATAARKAAGNGTETLNRATIAFIREGATVGDRHRLLYSSARNLAECGCPAALAYALLTEAGLDSGLPPSDVKRQIDCGLAATGGKQ